MPPKSTNTHHVTFHFFKSAVLLSVPSNTTINQLKTKLIPSLAPLSSTLTSSGVDVPNAPSSIQLWEQRAPVEGDESQDAAGGVRCLEDDAGVGGRTIAQLGWGRWKSLFVSFASQDGFSEPTYTVPDVEDEDPEDVDGGEP